MAQNRNEYMRKWDKECSQYYAVRIGLKTGIPAALDYALRVTGKTKNGFIIEAIREKLIRDGFMTETK